MQSLVSGSACTSISGIHEFDPFIKTISEMDAVESAFEDFRSKINGMNIQYPQHSVVPRVISMIETMVGPLEEKYQKEFAQDLKISVETVMPWDKFLQYSGV